MKKTIIKITVAVLLLIMTAGVAASCNASAPRGMYNLKDKEKFLEGVEDVIFSVPEDFKVTMASNMLAATREKESFSLQCRHADYYYKAGLKENYNELKAQLVALYGEYEEVLTDDGQSVAGKDALKAEYCLKIGETEYSYTQYLFYNGTKHFYLFTYCAPKGEENGALLKNVLDTISFEKKTYQAPAGYRTVENAEADSIALDRYEIFCPDKWIVDMSGGILCFRVPSSSILSNITFSELGEGKDLDKYITDYCTKVAPGLDLSEKGSDTEKYIAASVYRMTEQLKDFKLILSDKDTAKVEKEDLLKNADKYMGLYKNANDITLYYIDFTASLSDFAAHGSGSLFSDSSSNDNSGKPSYQTYKFRQYFVSHNDYLYLFTYTATEDRFKEQFEDAEKVVQYFYLEE